ncbi:Conidiation protein 6 [Ceratobasidium sp. AG-Ba]|nr:Conidiation protein 6 [Ceratobasidium sp. AG-Ba]QRV91478.1 Conidiation protein 6 [Ceratobasidium sp. AG-Ba]QRW05545.1 Conidiation protein 6 [Ceratobasidium sp. AG-Ba]
MFGSRRTTRSTTSSHHRRGLFHRTSPNRRAGGYKAALSNPNTTHEGRRHAKRELKRMGRGNEAHVSMGTRIKRALGIRSSPRRARRTKY